jgi:hypothetical protein
VITYAAPCVKPVFIPSPKRLRGAKRAGIKFELDLAKALPKAQHGQWWHFLDDGVPFWCQTDLVLLGAKRILVIECKLTNYAEGREQLLRKYLPVLRAAYPEREVLGVVALRHLSALPVDIPLFQSLRDVIAAPQRLGIVPAFHWLGGTAPL